MSHLLGSIQLGSIQAAHAQLARPAKPTGLTTRAANEAVILSWTNPKNPAITSWEYRKKTDGSYGDWIPFKGSWPVDRLTYERTITDLTNGTLYTFQLRALADLVLGYNSDEVSATPIARPAKPTGLTTRAANEAVILSWTNPKNPAITSWEYRKKTDGSYGNWIPFKGSWPVDSLTYERTITDLTNGTLYTFQLRALADLVFGYNSDEVSATPIAKPARPAKPTGLTIRAANEAVILSWTNPKNPAITSWQYRKKTDGSYGNWIPFKGSWPVDSLTYERTITDLTNGTLYTFQLRALADLVFGYNSDEVSATPIAKPARPAKPTGLTIRAANEAVILSWTNPKNPAITSWQYRKKTDGSYGDWIPFKGSWPVDRLTYERTITDLTNGTLYTFQLRALADLVLGYNSDEVSATPIARPAKPTGLTTRAANEAVILSWTNPKNPAITSWEYRKKTDGSYGNWIPFKGSWPVDRLTYERTITDLTNGTLYTFQLRALADLVLGYNSDEVSATPIARPAKPTGLTTRAANEAVILSWTNPKNPAITSWEYRKKTDGSYGNWIPFKGSWPVDRLTYERTITDLTNGTLYTFQLRALADLVLGYNSDEVSATPIARPAKPTGLTTRAANEAVILSWTNPKNPAITSWEYRKKTDGSYGDWIPFKGSWPVDRLTYERTITDLTNGTLYTFQLRALADLVLGYNSDEVSATPIAKPARPAKPTGLTIRAANEAVILSWTNPKNPAITSWQYRKKTDGSYGDWIPFKGSWPVDRLTYERTITDLTNGTLYTFQLRALADLVFGYNSDEVSATPIAKPARPAKPTGLTIRAANEAVILSWTNPKNPAITSWQYRKKTDGSYGDWIPFKGSWPVDRLTYERTITDLTNGTLYTFQLRALADLVFGYNSDEVSATPIAKPARPAKPTGLTIRAANEAVILSWTNPKNPAITSWQYRKKTDGSYGDWIPFKGSWPVDRLTYERTITDLTNGTLYTFQLRALADLVLGYNSDEVSATPIAKPARPAKPTGLTIRAANEAVILSWTNPKNPAITSWQYRKKTDGSYGDWIPFKGSWPVDRLTYERTITDLTNGTLYTFQLRALADLVFGYNSDEVSATPIAKPARPAKPTGLTIRAANEAVILSWTNPKNPAITSWQYRKKTDGSYGDWIPFKGSWPVDRLTYERTITDLTNGTLYTFQLRALADLVLGYNSDEVSATPIARPAKPTGLTIRAANEAVILSWTNPKNPAITSWEYRKKTDGSYGNWIPFKGSWPVDRLTYERTITDLTNGTLYTFQLRALADLVFGYNSDEVSATPIESGNTSPTVLPVLTISGGTAVTEGTAVSFTVTSSPIPTSSSLIILRNVEDAPSGDFLAADEEGDKNTWLFPRGQASQTFTIPTVADDVEEQSGAIFVTLSPGSGYTLVRPSSAKVTVMDDDKETLASERRAKRAWQTRLGRTVSHQVVDLVRQRFSDPLPPPGLMVTVAGEEITSAAPLQENEQVLSKLLGFEAVSGPQLVEGSAFSFSPQPPPPVAAGVGEGTAPPRLSLWSQGAVASFRGQEDDTLSLHGNVKTALVGVEWWTGRWQAGAALSHSWASGSYAGKGDNHTYGDLSSRLTGLFLYGRYSLTPRLSIWATGGHAWGYLSLKPDGADKEYQPAAMVMGAVGLYGLLLDGGDAGFSLSTTTDLLMVKTTTEETEGLDAAEGSVQALRLGLEATHPVPLPNDASILPSLEVGIRHDGGDGETGFGLEVGAGISWNDPQRGITAEVKGRSLVTHVEEEFDQQGLALSLAWDPSPSNRGVSLSLHHAVGATTKGIDALLSPDVMEGVNGASSDGYQFEAQLAYGFPAHNDRLTMTPGLAVTLSPTSRSYSLLCSLTPNTEQPRQGEPWKIALEGELKESNITLNDHSLNLSLSMLF